MLKSMNPCEEIMNLPLSSSFADARRSLLFTAFTLGVMAGANGGESISFNFIRGAGEITDTTTAKGPLGTSHWNQQDTPGATSGSKAALVSGSGVATSASITWNSQGMWSGNSGTGNENAKIANSYHDDGGAGVTVTVSDIPYAKYNVYGIVASDQGGSYSTRNFQVNGTWVFGGDATTNAPAFGNWSAAGSAWNRIDPATSQRGNYFLIKGQSGATATISGLGRNGSNRGSLAGIIIEESLVPDRLVRVGIDSFDEVALGAGLTSEFRVGQDLATVTTAGGFSVAATHAISIVPQPGTASGTYKLIDYDGAIGGAGFAGLSLTALPNPRYGLSLVDNSGEASVDLAYTAPTPIVWNGSTGGLWDSSSTANWKLATDSSPTQFFPFDVVKFDDSGAGNVVISGAVSPVSIELANESVAYAFTGDPITGSGGLTKTGAASLLIGTANTFTGPVQLFGGTTVIAAADNLGAVGNHPLELAGSTLQVTQTLTLGRKMKVLDAVELKVDSGVEVTAPGGFNGGGTLSKTGEGTLRFQNYGGGSFDGGIIVEEGSLVMAGNAFNSDLGIDSITVAGGAALVQPAGAAHALGGAFTASPNVTLEENSTYTVDAENYLDLVNLTGANLNGGNEIRTDYAFNATFFASAVQSLWSARINGVNSPVTFFVEDGPLEVDVLVSGPIVNSQPVVKNGPGTLELTGSNTYTGDTTVNAGILAVNGTALPDPGKLVIDGGKVAASGTEVVGTLFFGGVQQKAGTWGATGSGAENIDNDRFSGTGGVVQVTTGPGVTFAQWIATFPGAAGEPGFDEDPDKDGIDNGIEQILGTDPSVASIGLTQVSGTASSVTFRHSQTNNLPIDVTREYQWSSDLAEWKASGEPNTAGTITTIVPSVISDNESPANDEIEVVATASGTGTSRLFVRLAAAVNP
jgi:autotransporter-associated beta strand protein